MNFFSPMSNDQFFWGAGPMQDPAFNQYPNENMRDRSNNQRPPNYNNNGNNGNNNNGNFDLFGDTFAFMENLMAGVGQTINQMNNTMASKDFQNSNFPGVTFATSMVRSLSQQNGAKPRIVEASQEEVRGPEGLERTRRTVRDTARNVDKTEVAHRLGPRGVKVVQERDPVTGQFHENREADAVDDENQFEREWFDRAEQAGFQTRRGTGSTGSMNTMTGTSPGPGVSRSRTQQPTRSSFQPEPTTKSSSSRKDRRKEPRKK